MIDVATRIYKSNVADRPSSDGKLLNCWDELEEFAKNKGVYKSYCTYSKRYDGQTKKKVTNILNGSDLILLHLSFQEKNLILRVFFTNDA